jgi:nucleoside-diphosphate kinase
MGETLERTLFIVKPDAVERGLTGEILARVEADGFRLVGMSMLRLDADEARRFYYVHEGKPFLESLVELMSSGPVVACALERAGAVSRLREIVGATDPSQAVAGTIRKDFATNVGARVLP